MRPLVVLLLAGCGRIGFDATEPPVAAGSSALTSGDQFSCVIRPDRAVICWGDGRRGQLANGELSVITTPIATAIVGATQIDAGVRHACALLEDHRLVCWGDNSYRQLASTDMTPHPMPLEIVGLPAPVEQLVLGANHSCVLLTDRSLWCWGRNTNGELGIPASSGVATPTHILDDVLEADAGEAFTCALRGDHSVWCWGMNNYGQLGDGTTIERSEPRGVASLTADHISTGDKHACAVTAARYTCWGLNNNGELGDGTNTERHAPSTPSMLGGIVELEAGNDHNCALLDDGRVVC